jgi:hypothetical protein
MCNAAHVAVTHREIAVAVGPPGNGKTLAAQTAVERVLVDLNRHQGNAYRSVRLQVPKTRTSKTLYREWLRAICGTDVDGSEYDLGYMLLDLLSDGRIITILDEAQHLNTDGLEQARWVFDKIEDNTPIIAVGSTSLSEILAGSRQLRDRVARTVKFEGIPAKQLTATLAEYHPLFAGASPEVIAKISNRFAKHSWRRWARVLQAALRAAPALGHTGPIDPVLAKVILDELAPGR